MKSRSVSLSVAIAFVSALMWTPIVATAQERPSSDTFPRYARYGADVWARNPAALIAGKGKACISCHTSLPYALVEPLLEGEHPAYAELITGIDQRIMSWSTNTPWYSDDTLEAFAALDGLPPDALKPFLNAPDSRGPEAVFNALIRATHDAYLGQPAQDETRRAFENMWAEQVATGPAAGRWRWIQGNLVPWETGDADLWGASIACVAASIFPDLVPPESFGLLRTTLSNAASASEVSQHVKAAVLWCDAENGGKVLPEGVALQLLSGLLAKQRNDGGWALPDLGPFPGWEGSANDCCQKREIRPDAYATGFVALALERSRRLLTSEQGRSLDKAIAWIERQLANPYPDGPRYNKHESSDASLPEFRNSLYTNAGHMWSFFARTAHSTGRVPWAKD